MAKLLEKTTSFLKLVLVFGFVSGIIFALLGVWLVFLGSTGSTDFNLFGQTFTSANVGIAAVFIGAVVSVLVIRRLFKTLDQTIKLEVPETTESSS